MRTLGYLALLANSYVAFAQNSKTQGLKPTVIAGDLVQAREQIYAKVQDLKSAFPYKPPASQAPQLRHGKALYDEARSAYSNWITTLHLAIFDGSIKRLDKVDGYQKKTDAARKAGGEFVKYAEANTQGEKAMFAFASDLVTIGFKIYSAVKDRETKEKKDFLEEFDKIVKWDDWDTAGNPAKRSGGTPGSPESQETAAASKK